MITSPRASSMEMVDQTLLWPPRISGEPDSGSKVHFAAPVRASKAKTVPLGASVRRLSPIDVPVMTVSPMIAGAEVIWNSPGQRSDMEG